MNNTDTERAAFEAWLAPSWSRKGAYDEDGDFYYFDDWVQGAFVGWSAAQVQAMLAQGGAPGWQLVPVEPTREMIDAYLNANARFHSASTDWAVMLEAAPRH